MTTLTILQIVASVASLAFVLAVALAFSGYVTVRNQDTLMAWVVLPCFAVLLVLLTIGFFLQ